MAVSFGSTTLISSADMSATFQSEIVSLEQKGGFSVHAVFTGSPNGSLYLSVSINNSDFIVLSDSTQAISAAGDVFWNVDIAKYKVFRLHYTFSSGTGSLDAFFSTKEVV